MYERKYSAKMLRQSVPEEKKRRRKLPWKKISWAAVVLVVFIGVVMLSRWSKLQVQTIEVTGAQVTDPEDVSEFIRSNISGRFLSLFPKSSMFLVPTTSLSKWLQKEFPRFQTVTIRRSGLSSLQVEVSERAGVYLWCVSEDECSFMTEDGVVFSPAPFFSGDAYIKIYMGESGVYPFSPLTRDELVMITLLLERLPALSIEPQQIRQESEHEVVITFSHHGESSKLLIDPQNDVEEMLEDLATGLEAQPLQGKFSNEKEVLEYLDVRFANKVVYKFK